MKKRAYRMGKRAKSEEKTRLRITECAVELHGSLGPSRTSVSSIARQAGVRRSTVYRHFPDEQSLFTACTNHWLATNPLPDLRRWELIRDADERFQAGLTELYAHYRRTRQMMVNILRDEELMPVVKEKLRGLREYLSAAREKLIEGRKMDRAARRRVRAVLGHALAFATWHSLAAEQRLKDAECVRLMQALVKGASK